ncbi:sialidase family protein [Mycoplasmopsis cricetuli]|uniref:sialidase family protein n=1 Tax=Mycoplasmopsis cricetuli TaxID=171283 RepID=UPI00046FD04B|nr:sialidase family protein [Mycoplasmopsis cricetuli]
MKIYNRITFTKEKAYFLKPVENHEGWMQMFSIKDEYSNIPVNNINSFNQLQATEQFIDLRLGEENTLTGQIFEKIKSFDDLNNPEKLASSATEHSIFDQYFVSNPVKRKPKSHKKISYNNKKLRWFIKQAATISMESEDGGLSWKNLKFLNSYIDKNENNEDLSSFKFKGNAVGSGISLKYQKNPKLNNRILLPFYAFLNYKTHAPFLLVSDDFGKSWTRKKVDIKEQISESTLLETQEGVLYWFFRNVDDNGNVISKSLDGGETWQAVHKTDQGQNYSSLKNNSHANVFSGLELFRYQDKNYFIFAAPRTKAGKRTNGALFLTDETFEKVVEIFNFDTKDPENKNHFGYSKVLSVKVENNKATVLVAYETENKYDDLPEVQTEILLDEIELEFLKSK